MTRIATFAAAAVVGLFTLAGAASAQEFQVRPTLAGGAFGQDYQTTVSLSGLDLSRESDARIALQRIDRAATAVCGGQPDDTYSDSEKQAYQDCHAQSVRRAVTHTRSAMMIALMITKGPTLLAKN
jgi:UrcA family protein